MADKNPGKLRNIVVATVIIVGVTAVWLVFMAGVLKLFAAGYVVMAWLIIGAVAYFVLRRNKK